MRAKVHKHKVSVILATSKNHYKTTYASITDNVKNDSKVKDDTAKRKYQKHKVSVILATSKNHHKTTYASITDNVKTIGAPKLAHACKSP